jgi:predicted RNA-binding Zn-ribbon protein involved in translation (DUF1610 family)
MKGKKERKGPDMVITYQCPNCGSSMTYRAEDGKLHCTHCDTVKTVEEMEADRQEEEGASGESGSDAMQVFRCPSCGAEILTDEYTMASVCSFCGSPDLIRERMEGEQRPEWIIPFTISRQEAENRFLKWTHNGFLTPRDFTSRPTLDKITGMYVPFWLYDLRAEARIAADCTNTFVTRFGDRETIHTRHFDVRRDVTAEYLRVPADASKKMDDTLMDQMEPFRYDQLRPFEMPYLSGYQAEKFNFPSEELYGRVRSRAEEYAGSSARETIQGYETVLVRDKQVSVTQERAAYALLPVWMLRYRYLGKDYSFTLNGNTGKVIGELPISRGKMIFWGLVIGAAAFAALSLGSILIGGLLG